MNRIFRLVFNRALGQVQVASELAVRHHGGTGAGVLRLLSPAPLAFALAFACGGAWAQVAPGQLPTGEQVRHGSADFSRTANLLQIVQNGRTVIDWTAFDIGSNARVDFVQSAGSIALNRVTGGNVSQIFGALDANAGVFLINPSGIVFGAGSQVNVGSLMASTMGLGPQFDGDTRDPLLRFYEGDNTLNLVGGTPAAVVNYGDIRTHAPGGSISLIGASVFNGPSVPGGAGGTLTADQGAINLVGAGRADVELLSTHRVFVQSTTNPAPGAATLVDNAGRVQADGGSVTMVGASALGMVSSAVNTRGVITANSLGGITGRVELVGINGDVSAGGTITSSGDVSLAADRGQAFLSGMLDSQTLSVTGTAIRQTAGRIDSGATRLTAYSYVQGGMQAGDISLTSSGNVFGGTTFFYGRDVTLAGSSSLRIGGGSTGGVFDQPFDALRATRNLSLDLAGAITQTGEVRVDGNTSLSAGGAVSLMHGGNDFVGSISASGTDITLHDRNNMTLGALSSSGHTIMASAAGTLTQTQAIDAGIGAVALSSGGLLATGHSISGGTVDLHGGSGVLIDHLVSGSSRVNLSSDGAIVQGVAGGVVTPVLTLDAGSVRLDAGGNAVGALGDVDIEQDFELVNTGDITQVADTAVVVGGTTTLDAGNRAVVLDNVGNDFGGTVSATARGIALRDANDLRIGTLVNAADADLSLIAGADLVLPGAAIDTGSGALTLRAGNQLSTPGALRGGVVDVYGGAGLTLAHDITAGTRLRLGSGGTITQQAGMLDAPRLDVDAGAAAELAQAGNRIGALGDVATGARFALRNDGAIAQLAGTALDVGGNLDLNAGSAAIAIGNAGNQIGGEATLSGSTISARTAGNLRVASIDAGADQAVSLVAGGALTLGSGVAIDTGTAALTLASDGGALSTSGGIAGGDVHLRGRDGIRLNNDLRAGGTLELESAAGTILQFGGAITAAGTTRIAAAGDVSLTGAANTFSGPVTLSGADLDIRSAGTLRLGAVDGSALRATASRIELDRSIATTGDQSYAGAVRLAADLTLESTGGGIAFGSSVDGAHALTARAANALAFGGAVGADTRLSSLDASGAGIALGGNVVTSGLQIYRDAVTLTGNAGLQSQGGDIDFVSTVDGAHALQVTTSGTVGFGGAVGGTQPLASLAVNAGGIRLGGDVSTSGDQTYGGAVLLTGDSDLASANSGIAFAATVDGAHRLDATAANAVSFGGAIGGNARLAALAVDAGSVSTAAGVAVTGDLSIDADTGGLVAQGQYLIGGTSTFDTGDGRIELAHAGNDFAGRIDIAGAGDVVIADANALTFGTVTAASLDATARGDLLFDTTTLTDALTARSTEGLIRHSGAAHIGGATTLTARHDIMADHTGNAFTGTISLEGANARIIGRDALRFGAVNVSTLQAVAPELWLGAAMNSVGFQLYAGDVRLSQDTRIASDVGDIEIRGTVDGAHALDIASGGRVFLRQAVGGDTALTALDIGTGAGDNIFLGGDVATVGDQDYRSAVWLSGDAALESMAGDIVFRGSVDGAYDLDATARAGAVSFAGAVGAAEALGALDVDANTFQSPGITVAGDLGIRIAQGDLVQGGVYRVGGDARFATGGGAIDLSHLQNAFAGQVGMRGGDAVIVNGGSLRFGVVDVDALRATAAGSMMFEGPVSTRGDLQTTSAGALGQGAALSVGGTAIFDALQDAITLDNADNAFGGMVHVRAGAASIAAADALTFGTLSVASLDATAHGGDLRFDGPALVTGALDARAGGAIGQNGAPLEVRGTARFGTDGGAITLDGQTNRFLGLVHLDGGDATIRNQAALRLGTVEAASLDATATQIELGAGAIATDGEQIYRAAVTLTDDTSLTSRGGGITFASTVDGAYALQAMAEGTVAFGAAVGTGAALASLDVDASRIELGHAVTTLGNQTYGGAVALTGDAALTSTQGDIGFEATVDGAHALDVIARTGTVNFTGAVGAEEALAALSVESAAVGLGAAVATDGSQTYDSAVTLVGDTSLRSTRGDIAFGATVDGAHRLDATAQAGAVTVVGDIGATQRLDALTVDALTFDGRGIAVDDALAIRIGQGDLVQGGVYRVGGDARFATGGGAIDLSHLQNAFAGQVGMRGGDAVIVNGGSLRFGVVDVDALRATAAGSMMFEGPVSTRGDLQTTSAGALGQGAALSVGGTAIFDALQDAITLDNADNAFGGMVHVRAGAASIAAADALTFGTLSVASLDATAHGGDLRFDGPALVTGALDAHAAGAIGQNGAPLEVRGTARFGTDGGAITLDGQANRFLGIVHLDGGDAVIGSQSALHLGAVDAASLDVRAASIVLGAGDIVTRGDQTYRGAVTLAAATRLGATTGDIRFADSVSGAHGLTASADGHIGFSGPVAVQTLDMDAGTVTFDGALDIADRLTVNVRAGGVAQNAAFTVGGQTRIDANGGAITLTHAGNDFGGVVQLAGGEVSIRDANALTLGDVTAASLDVGSEGALVFGRTDVATTLVADSGAGAISQTDAVTVGGTATFVSGDAITLTHAGNDFGGVVQLAGGEVSIRDANALTLGAVTAESFDVASEGALVFGRTDVASALVADSGAGAISQTGAVTVGGTATFVSGDAITLTHAGNDFGGVVQLAGGEVSIRDANALTLGDVTAASFDVASEGDLVFGRTDVGTTLVADSGAGAISQTDAVTVGGTATFASGAAITLTDAGNDFGGAVSLAGTTVSIRDANALTLGDVTAASLDVGSEGALVFGRTDVASTLFADSGAGAISQTDAVTVGGTATFASGDAITLTDAGNDFGGAVSLAGTTVSIRDANALTLDTVHAESLDVASEGALVFGRTDVATTLVADSGAGAISQTDAVTVGGTATFASGAAITLTDAGNDFGGAVSLAGTTVSIRDANALTLGDVTAASFDVASEGDLVFGRTDVGTTLVADSGAGAISQTDAVTVGGTATFASGAAITLTDAGNDFGGAVSLAGTTVSIRDANALTLGDVTAASLDVGSEGALVFGRTDVASTLFADSGAGAISQTDAVTVGGTATFASGDAITLTDAGNDFGGAVSLAGTTVSIRDANALTLDTVHAESLDVASEGALVFGRTDVATTLVADSGAGAISQTDAVTVGGTATFASGAAITLTDAGNDFGGAVSLAGTTVSIRDANALTLGTVHAESLDIASEGALVFGRTDVASTLVADSGAGAIAQTDAVTVGGTATFASGDAITLTDAGNDFGGAVSLAGTTVSIRDANALTLGDVTAASLDVASEGDLVFGRTDVGTTLVADSGAGAISQTGALAVGGATALTSGAAITLTDAGNDFGGAVSLAGTTVSIVDANALTLDTVRARTLDVSSHGALGFGDVVVDGMLAARSHGGAIGQVDALRVGGASTLDAGNGDIQLDHAGNDFAGAVDIAGGAISLRDANDLTLSRLVSAAGHDVSLVAGGALTLPVQAIDTGSGALRLVAQGGGLHTRGALAGGSVSLDAAQGITLAHDVNARDRLSLRSGGDIAQTGGRVKAGVLDGHAAGSIRLEGANAITSIDSLSAQGIRLENATSLSIDGPVSAGDGLQMAVIGGDLAINGRLAATDMRLESSGGIVQGTNGQLVARTLSGRAGGAVVLGDAGTFIDNQVERIGDFTARSGFSMTNGRGLTLASLNGSSFTIDAGIADFFLSVDGDLLQDGTDWLYNGRGTWAATGRIGQPASPIYVTALEAQRVAAIGIGPAYFYALRPDGSLLPIEGESAVNVPTSVWAGRAQSSSNRQVAYVDVGADASNYRPYGVVETGIRLPPDQTPECDPDFPSDECVEGVQ